MSDGETIDRFGTVTESAINNGEVTDAYFLRTEETLDHIGSNPPVVAEVSADQFSDGDEEVLVGVEYVIELLRDMPVDMYALPEGSLFDGGPVMRIEGGYRDFARYETALLGLLSEASGYATKTKEIVEAADGTPVMSFGSRHNHPATAAVLERAAYIGGADGYSNVIADSVIPPEPSGTMPHALMLSIRALSGAWHAFNDAVSDDVPRIVLADTWRDEVHESTKAARTLGDDLDAVRLDTTSSRRGDFEEIIKEVRYELDAIGREDVDIYVSGGLDTEDVRELTDLVDGFGIGGAISDAPSVDFGLDIVQVEGEDTSKRGKLPGVKDVEMRQFIDDGLPVDDNPVRIARNRARGGPDPAIDYSEVDI